MVHLFFLRNQHFLYFCLFIAFELLPELYGQDSNESAITFETSITGDFNRIFSGGVNPQPAFQYMGLEDAVLILNTEKCGLWKGGMFLLHGQNIHGATPSASYTGDYQVFSNIEAGDHTGFFEFYFQQSFGPFTLTMGQQDMNSNLCVSEYGGLFINSSFGIMPSISLNVPVGIFPIGALGIFMEYATGEKSNFKTAIYDGDPEDISSNRYNLNFEHQKGEGLLYIGEYEYNNFDANGDNFKLGAYYHSDEFNSLSDTTAQIKGNYGIYGIVDKRILEPSGYFDNGVNVFLQLGFAPASRNLVSSYIGFGVNTHTPFRRRIHDNMGCGVAFMKVGKDFKNIYPESLSAETALEFTYQFFIGNNYFIQPDLQYIIHPGATKGIDNALTGTMRFSLSF